MKRSASRAPPRGRPRRNLQAQKVLKDGESAERDPTRKLARPLEGGRKAIGPGPLELPARTMVGARDKLGEGAGESRIAPERGGQDPGEREEHLEEIGLVAAGKPGHEELLLRLCGERGGQLDLEESRREERDGPGDALAPDLGGQ